MFITEICLLLKYNYSANLNRLFKNIQLNGYVLKQLASCIEKKNLVVQIVLFTKRRYILCIEMLTQPILKYITHLLLTLVLILDFYVNM